ncbi:MAG: capsular polysaccharide biosynthesis protein [Burkholderiaceae bacterium]
MTEALIRLLATSGGIRRIPLLGEILGVQVLPTRTIPSLRGLGKSVSAGQTPDVVAGWGAKPSGRKAEQIAQHQGVSCWRLEDGFLRSFGLGDRFAPLSLTVDPIGVYYDASRPSTLEQWLNDDKSFGTEELSEAKKARNLIVKHRLSKYNHAPDALPELFARDDRKVVLVVDQTLGDMSIELAGAREETFAQMLAAARSENPYARIIVKTHPEVNAGRKAGHLGDTPSDSDTLILSDLVNPISLLEQVDVVYTVSSHLGFEALMLGKPVHCFGVPWYAGWGLTQDRQFCARRRQRRSVDELFAAAYLRLSRYLNPVTHRRGSIFDVIEFLCYQREMARREPLQTWCVGFRRWKAHNVRPMLGLHQNRIRFVDTVDDVALPSEPNSHTSEHAIVQQIIHWGAPRNIRELKSGGHTGEMSRHVQMEDGFIRSVGLGSDLVRPTSLVIDQAGIYFDPGQPSDLERLLSHATFSKQDLNRAARIRNLLIGAQLTKYNTDSTEPPCWPVAAGQVCLLVPGQVADDASVRLAGAGIGSNEALLAQVRHRHPDAFIVYRPHPDVLSGNRKGVVPTREALKYADYIEREAGILGCIEVADEIHTLSSLTGFDALIRAKPVTTYGQPFYAGWGLTRDFAPVARRDRTLSLEELIAGCLIHYPRYWDWTLNAYTHCEAALSHLIEQRTMLTRSTNGTMAPVTYWQRQVRKLVTLGKAWTAH